MRSSSARRYLVGGASILVALGVWQWLVTGPFSDKPFATVPEIASQLVEFAGAPEFWSSMGDTLLVALVGLLLSIVAGVALGVLIGTSDFAYRSTRLIIEFLKPIPPIVILPLLVLVFGPTSEMGIVLVFFGGVFVLATQTSYGVRDVDPVTRDTARSFRLTVGQRVRNLVMPTALPFLATGIRVCGSAALVIAIVSEIVGGAPGLGRDMVLAQTTGDYPVIYALVVVFGILGLLLNALLSQVERRVLFWHPSVRSELPV